MKLRILLSLLLTLLLLCGCGKKAEYLSAETLAATVDAGGVDVQFVDISVGEEQYIEFEMTNKTDSTIMYGEDYSVHYVIEGHHLELVKPETVLAFDDVDYPLESGETKKIKIDLDHYDLSKTGKYQIHKDYYLNGNHDQHFLFLTFEVTRQISADISFNGAYANAGYSDELIEAMYDNCLNKSDTPSISSARPTPLLKITSVSELEAFKESYGEYFWADSDYDEVPAFNEVCEEYDTVFFRDRALFICYVWEGSGSTRHEVQSVRLCGERLTLTIKRRTPQIGTMDMAGRFLLADVKADDVDRAESYTVVITE